MWCAKAAEEPPIWLKSSSWLSRAEETQPIQIVWGYGGFEIEEVGFLRREEKAERVVGDSVKMGGVKNEVFGV